MKFFKVSVMATALTFVMGTAYAADSVNMQPSVAAKTVSSEHLANDNQKASYALGVSMGRYLESSVKQQEALGVELDKGTLLTGVQDGFANKSKLTDQEINTTLQAFDTKLQTLVQEKLAQEAKVNAAAGAKFAEKFAKQPGVKKTASGLLYKVEKSGQGEPLKGSDTVVVNYKGMLTDNKVFDDSFKRGQPLTIRLDSVIPGWAEGLKHIRKGGEITIVVPPKLAYGESGMPGVIPPNATLMFHISLLDVNPKGASNGANKTHSGTKVETAKDKK